MEIKSCVNCIHSHHLNYTFEQAECELWPINCGTVPFGHAQVCKNYKDVRLHLVNEENNVTKIKVTSAEIIVHGTANKPYYEIKYYPVGEKECHIGYSSYNLDFVFEWLYKYFEVISKCQE